MRPLLALRQPQGVRGGQIRRPRGPRRLGRGAVPGKKAHHSIHRYRGYWSDGGRGRIRIYQEDGRAPVVICSQLPDNPNTSVTNMAEYLAAEVIKEHSRPTPLA